MQEIPPEAVNDQGHFRYGTQSPKLRKVISGTELGLLSLGDRVPYRK